MKHSKLFLILLIAAFLAMGFIAGCGSSDDDGGSGTDTGNCSGTVTDNNGNAVSGATCTVTTTDTKAVFSDETDNDGLFLIPNIPVGTWPLGISRTGYQTLSLSVTIGSGTTTEVPTDQTVIVPSTGTGNVTGTVNDATAEMVIEGATVAIGSTQATSSAAGAYTLSGITPGAQTITANKNGYENYSSSVNVVADTTVTHNIDMTSSAPEPGKGHVKGKVVDENGNALSGVTVTSGTVTATTDTNGEYTLMNLDPGAKTLSFAKTGYDNATVNVTIVADQTVTANTVTMTTGITTGTTVLCSVPRTTENGAKGANYSSCTDDGAYVNFIGDQPLLAIHISNAIHTYLYSRSSGTVTMIDMAPDGLEGSLNGGVANSVDSHICGDGSLVAFTTNADNLLGPGNDANAARDIYVYHRTTGKISRVSVDYSNSLLGGYADDTKTTGAASRDAKLSKNGGYVTFRSQAKNIVSPGFITDVAAIHTTWNVYRVKLDPGGDGYVAASSPLLISGRQLDGKECDPADWGNVVRTSEEPWISSDGRFIVYSTNALPGAAYAGAGIGTAGDTLLNDNAGYRDANADRDIVLCDLEKTVQTRTAFISQDDKGVKQLTGVNDCEAPSVSDDGTRVVFECDDAAGRWITGNDAFSDVWLKNLSDGSLIRVSNAGSGQRGISAPGMISRDGTLVAFSSFGTGFVQNDTNGARDCFIYDIATGTFTRVSLGSNNNQADNNCFRPYLSGNNQYVSFTSPAKNLADNPYLSPGSFDVYLRKWK